MDIQREQERLVPQEEPYTLEDLSVTIATSDHSVSISNAILQIAEEGFTILKEISQDSWQTIFTNFSNTTSVGSDGTTLLIFVGDNQIQEQEQMPQTLKMISNLQAQNIILSGSSYTVSLDLSKLGVNVLKQIHDLMVGYMGDANDRISNYEEDDEFAEMISADNIDQNGDIIGHQRQDSEESEEEQENK